MDVIKYLRKKYGLFHEGRVSAEVYNIVKENLGNVGEVKLTESGEEYIHIYIPEKNMEYILYSGKYVEPEDKFLAYAFKLYRTLVGKKVHIKKTSKEIGNIIYQITTEKDTVTLKSYFGVMEIQKDGVEEPTNVGSIDDLEGLDLNRVLDIAVNPSGIFMRYDKGYIRFVLDDPQIYLNNELIWKF